MPNHVVLVMPNDDGDLLRITLDDDTKEIISQEVLEESEQTQIRTGLRAARARVLRAVVAGRAEFIRTTPTLADLVRQTKLLTAAVSILIMQDLDIGDADVTPDTVAVRVGIPTRRPGRAIVPVATVAVPAGVPAAGVGAGSTAVPDSVAVVTEVPHPDITTEVGEG